jgi:hypothetical protein
MNLLIKVFNIRTQNIILFNDVFRITALDEFGNLKKEILYNFSKVQPEELNQFVIEKLEQGDVLQLRNSQLENINFYQK